jgi:hypothetical protein
MALIGSKGEALGQTTSGARHEGPAYALGKSIHRPAHRPFNRLLDFVEGDLADAILHCETGLDVAGGA